MRRLRIACSLVVACAGPNYYDVLGVGPRATTDQIRAAWKAPRYAITPTRIPKTQRAPRAHEAHQHGERRALRSGEAPGARRRASSAACGRFGLARRVHPAGGAVRRAPLHAPLLLLPRRARGLPAVPQAGRRAHLGAPPPVRRALPDAVLGAFAAVDAPRARARGSSATCTVAATPSFRARRGAARAVPARRRRPRAAPAARAHVVAGAAARRPRPRARARR